MKDYKRLTGAEGLGVCDAEYCENDDCLSCAAQINYDRLAELEDKIESGEVCDGAELEQVIKARDEYKHRAEVAERALRNAAPRLNCRGGLGKGFCRVDKCDYYHCNNDEGCVKAHLQQAENAALRKRLEKADRRAEVAEQKATAWKDCSNKWQKYYKEQAAREIEEERK